MATLEHFSDVIRSLQILKLEDRVQQEKRFPPEFEQPNWLPYRNGLLTPALFGLNWNLLTHEVQSFVQDITEHNRIDILAQVPGEGKTCRLLGLTHEMYVVLITCTQRDPVVSSEVFSDVSFEKFLSNIITLDKFDAISTITKEVCIYYLARFAHLLLCLQKRDTVPSTVDYLRLQLNGNGHVVDEIYADVRATLLPYNVDVVRRLLAFLIEGINIELQSEKFTKPKKFALCIDELNVVASQETKRYVSLVQL